eukprot:6429000-Heterocapsa_arctica.AAC.1
MDVTYFAESEQAKGIENKMPEIEKLAWDLETIRLHEELNAGRTCSQGQTIVSGLLCHKNACITCSAIRFNKGLYKDRSGTEATDIIELYKMYKTEIDQMNE